MRKVEIKFNEKKIKAEGEYELESIYEVLDNAFVGYADMQKSVETDGTIVYFAPIMKDENHYAKIWVVIKKFVKAKWFNDIMLKYLYGDTYGSDDPKHYSIEDILEEWEVGKSVL